MKTLKTLAILLTLLTLLSLLSLLSISYAYSDFDRVMSKCNIVRAAGSESPSGDDKGVYDKCDADIILQHLVNTSIKNGGSVGILQTIFFVHDRLYQKPALIVVTTAEEFFLITKEKTYYIEEHEISNLHANYKFVYYITDKVDMDFSNISLVDIEYTFQTFQL
jgi:hypothetical protein